MKPEKQILAIAEARGWRCKITDSYEHLTSWNWVAPDGRTTIGDWVTKKLCLKKGIHVLPNYLHDLDDMHKVETTYPWDEDGNPTYNDYIETLKEVHGSEFSAFSAPSKTRAEAFLRTLGKWEEGA